MKSLFHQFAIFVALALLSTASAAAQADLPGDVITAVRLDSAQEDVIRVYIEQHGPRLADEEPRIRQQARNALLRPLMGGAGDPSAAFRLAYNRSLYGPLRDLEQHEELGVVIGALRIAGSLGAENGYLALRRAVRDERPAVRYRAASEMGRLLRIEAEGRGVLPSQRIDEAIELLESRLAEETNIQVVDGIVLALAGLPEGTALRGRSMQSLVRGGAKQAAARHRMGNAATDEEVLTLLRATRYARDTLTGAQAIDPTFAQRAMEFAGHTLAYCLTQLEAEIEDELLRQHLLALATTSEATLILGHDVVRREQLPEQIRTAFERALAGGQSDAARRAVMEWIGPNGRLARAPYNMDPRGFGVGAGAGAGR